MKDELKKDESAKKGKIIVVSEEAQLKDRKDLTLKEICEADHVGRCGYCDEQGRFTACA
ncbi:hypothetical protein [Mucilaginibacter sp. AK015]|uniref:hypothetical protein n=1 Tax=Mucilaginibacter sp. AK015 TaxID=2723072 RepID=UPI001616D260|nr:hypothetical protein [Mucilaginibacter sp. AK015]MBB5397732.1 hypothetical protein [Mucilaginibacter sp. AK015]